jgi:DNA ligase-4
MIFDVLHVNGKDIIGEPLRKRRKVLEKIVVTEPHVIEIVPQVVVTNTAEIYQALDTAILNRYVYSFNNSYIYMYSDEGIIIKNIESAYNPGERKHNWIKLKPDHVDGMGETVDLIIMGGYYGTKFNRKSVSHFLLGVSVHDKKKKDDKPQVFYTCCKVGSGYTSSELLELQKQLEPHWIRYDKSRGKLPEFFAGWEPQAGELPDVYIEPYKYVLLFIH